MLQFNDFGYLLPYGPIVTTLDDFEREFVVTRNPRRERIFKTYLNLLERLQRFELAGFHQWLDGSFVTQKESPKDLDIVTFVDFRQYAQMIDPLYELHERFEHRRLDLYFSPIPHPEDPSFEQSKTYQGRWIDLFSSDREGNPKGFLEIHFQP